MIHPESKKKLYFDLTRMPVLKDIKEECTDELRECYGQLLAMNRESEHTLCDGVEEAYRVRVCSIKLEKCLHPGCGAQFYTSPGQNL